MREGMTYATRAIPSEGMPLGTLVKVIKINDDGTVLVQRASGEQITIKAEDILG